MLCNHAQFFKLNVYFFCRIDADGHQNQWRRSSTPTNTFHEDRTPFPFLPLTALFLFCAPQSCTQIAHASRPRRRSQRSSRRWAPPIMIRPTTPHICSPDVVPPITDHNRGAVFRFQGTKSDARHHYHHTRPFARFHPARDPFRSASSLPVAPFPSAARPCPRSLGRRSCQPSQRRWFDRPGRM